MGRPVVDLEDKVVMITGAARGMGAAHARALAGHGTRVVLTDIDVESAEDVARDLVAAGGDALALPLDVADENAWAQALERTWKRHGRVDGLVNNAGLHRTAPFLETTTETLDLLHRVNVRGAMLGMQAVAPHMSSGGSVVNVASVAGMGGCPDAAAYAASKWAIRGLSRTAALELGPHGIRVNCVCPGAVDTQMISEEARAGGGPVANLPIRRPARPQEISAVVAFLLSDASSYCTGQDFVVDGGMKA